MTRSTRSTNRGVDIIDQSDTLKHADLTPEDSACGRVIPRRGSMSRVTDQRQQRHLDYSLNRSKAMKQKYSACSRSEPLLLETTGGGLRIRCQTGMYEAMRAAIPVYYNGSIECHIQNTDQDGNVVGETYKINTTDDRSHPYTINLYHTTSSLLVNGTGDNIFLSKDLDGLMAVVITCEKSLGMSVRALNVYMKKTIATFEDQQRCAKQRDGLPNTDYGKNMQKAKTKTKKRQFSTPDPVCCSNANDELQVVNNPKTAALYVTCPAHKMQYGASCQITGYITCVRDLLLWTRTVQTHMSALPVEIKWRGQKKHWTSQ